jgi:hypothetical protein
VVPDHLGLDSAVALLADGRTATMLVRAAELGKGERVLVEAAAGGVGTLLVQLAQAAGATVAAAAGGARKVELARCLGAEVAVDYREPGWTARVREDVGGVDVVFDGVGGDIAGSAFGLLRRGGRLLSFGMASGEWAGISTEAAADRGVKAVGIPRPTPEETRLYRERYGRGNRRPAATGDRATVPPGAGSRRARRHRGAGHPGQDAAGGTVVGPMRVDVGHRPARTWSAWPAPPEPTRPLDGGEISTSLAHNLVAIAFVLTSEADDSR